MVRDIPQAYREKLGMGTSTYDPCLLFTWDENGPFGLVGMQTDDILILGDNEFVKHVKQEVVELKRAKLLAKPSITHGRQPTSI